MHPLFRKADQLSHTAIGAAIEVHRLKGPGLIESIYEKCFMRELSLRQVAAVNQRIVKIEYKASSSKSHFASMFWSKIACYSNSNRSRRSCQSIRPNC